MTCYKTENGLECSRGAPHLPDCVSCGSRQQLAECTDCGAKVCLACRELHPDDQPPRCLDCHADFLQKEPPRGGEERAT